MPQTSKSPLSSLLPFVLFSCKSQKVTSSSSSSLFSFLLSPLFQQSFFSAFLVSPLPLFLTSTSNHICIVHSFFFLCFWPLFSILCGSAQFFFSFSSPYIFIFCSIQCSVLFVLRYLLICYCYGDFGYI